MSIAAPQTTQYLTFEPLPRAADARTDRVLVVSRSSGDTLGTVKWFGRWRQYCFFPAAGTIYNPDCLRAIEQYASALTRAHRAARRSS